MFNSIYLNGTNIGLVALMIGLSLVDGIIVAFLCSLKLRARKGVFITTALLPAVVATVFCVLNVLLTDRTASAITSIAAIMIGMGLIRFRSAPAKAEEILILLMAVAIGAINGLGYVAYAAGIAIILPLVYFLLATFNIFNNKKFSSEKILKITIPESLEYSGAFDSIFERYLKEVEMVGVKTTGMGSMFRLSYRIVMKDIKEEKAMIDELRTRNGNLEISVLPFVEDPREL
ncbi:MAG: DUF4956 domain-containing protein [Clostridia bacterium]|nr:DUF4956 domain-containing protein [Clostridia bacterium]